MAINEKQFQKELISDSKVVGVFAYKNTPDFNKGILDLTLVKGVPHTRKAEVTWLELKFVNKANAPGFKGVNVELSDFQRHFGEKLSLHGAIAAWCVGVRVSNREWVAYVGTDFTVTHVTREELLKNGVVRRAGERWDINTILKRSKG